MRDYLFVSAVRETPSVMVTSTKSCPSGPCVSVEALRHLSYSWLRVFFFASYANTQHWSQTGKDKKRDSVWGEGKGWTRNEGQYPGGQQHQRRYLIFLRKHSSLTAPVSTRQAAIGRRHHRVGGERKPKGPQIEEVRTQVRGTNQEPVTHKTDVHQLHKDIRMDSRFKCREKCQGNER